MLWKRNDSFISFLESNEENTFKKNEKVYDIRYEEGK
jgi:hypothetical protein